MPSLCLSNSSRCSDPSCKDCFNLQHLNRAQSLTITRYFQNLDDPAKAEELRVRPVTETRLQPSHVNGTPTIFLMGLRRSGKTSAAHVLLHDLPSANTLHLEPTLTPKRYTWESVINVNILELPADHPTLDPSDPVNQPLASAFTNLTSIIWFLDSQDEYLDSLELLHSHILSIYPTKPRLNLEIFIHKTDGLSDDFRTDIYRDIQTRVPEELADAQIYNPTLTFYQTSVYDKTLHEAFSRVIQKLIPELPTIASLIDSLTANCGMVKAYIFDTKSNLYIASDTTPGSLPIYETCSDYLDMISEFSQFYDWRRRGGVPGGGSVPGETGVVTESLITMEKRGTSGMCCREIDDKLMLICMLGNESPGKKKPLLDFNLGVFHRAVKLVLERTMGRAQRARASEPRWVEDRVETEGTGKRRGR